MNEDIDDIKNYDFVLPVELVAETPATRRDGSRLLLASTVTKERRIAPFEELLGQLNSNDLLVFNNSRVVPARVFAHKTTGGRVELLFLDVLGSESPTRWVDEKGRIQVTAMFRTSKSLEVGTEIFLVDQTALRVMSVEHGHATLELDAPEGAYALLSRLGELPLPPYIVKKRVSSQTTYEHDEERYQTIYAANPGSVAAPTAGLHFSSEVFEALDRMGVRRAYVTLEVGPGTFQPVKASRLSEHVMHSERYFVDSELRGAIEETRARGGRVIAVGTTSVRVLESEARLANPFEPGTRHSTLFLSPGDDLKVVDAMITNFHLPRSTLLALVSAFAGLDFIKALYAEAIAERMHFYSYGDAMFLTREALK